MPNNDNWSLIDILMTKLFQNITEFLKQDLLVPLNAPNVALGVCEIIQRHVPKLKSLNLSYNKIFTIRHFSTLKTHANELKSIDLSRNRVTNE